LLLTALFALAVFVVLAALIAVLVVHGFIFVRKYVRLA
jgi:hypothetical protein